MVYGENDIKVNVPESMAQGTNEAISTMTKYIIIAGVVILAGKTILDKKTLDKIKNRFIGV